MGRNMELVCPWTGIGFDFYKGNVITFAWWCNWSLVKPMDQLAIKASGCVFGNPFMREIIPWKGTIKCDGNWLMWRQSSVFCVYNCDLGHTRILKNKMSVCDGYMFCISFVLYETVNTWAPVAWNSVNSFLKYEQWVLTNCLTCRQFFGPTTVLQVIAWNGISWCFDFDHLVATNHVGQEQSFCVVAN